MLSPPAFSFPTKVLLLAEMNRKIKSMKEREIVMITIRSVYKELHADYETGAADNK